MNRFLRDAAVSAGVVCLALTMTMARGLNVDPNQSGAINVSSNNSTPTQIFTSDPAATRSYIVNTSTNNLFIVGFSTLTNLSISSAAVVSANLNSTGSFYLTGSSGTVIWSPDGPLDAYTGPLWAVAGGTGATILRFRAH